MPSFPNPVFPDRDAANRANSAPSAVDGACVYGPVAHVAHGFACAFPRAQEKKPNEPNSEPQPDPTTPVNVFHRTNPISPEPSQSKGFAHAAPPHRDPIPPPGRPSG
jgi:hypothetical protein